MYGIKGAVPPTVVCWTLIHPSEVFPRDIQPRLRGAWWAQMQLSYKPLSLECKGVSPTQTWGDAFLVPDWKLPERKVHICTGQFYNPRTSHFQWWSVCLAGWIDETSKTLSTLEKFEFSLCSYSHWFLHKSIVMSRQKGVHYLIHRAVKKAKQQRVPHREFPHKEEETRGKVTLKMHVDIF